MLDGNTDTIKRYAPPQRNRVLNRRKSGDRFEKVNYPYGVDGEKSRAPYSASFPTVDHGDAGGSNIYNENANLGLIPLDGCSTSEAAQLLNERWVAAVNSCNDPSIDLSGRPVMYSGATGSSWGHKVSHQMDFLAELRRAIHDAQSGTPSTFSIGDQT